MRIHRARTTIVPVLLIAMAACHSATGSSVFSASAVVFGRVTDASGAPVVNATVRALAYDGTCGAAGSTQVGSGSPDVVLTDVDGAYRQRVVAIRPNRYCVVVNVQPPAQTGLASTTSSAEVQFKPTETPPYDSSRVDIGLR
jgi:hypothetical protein